MEAELERELFEGSDDEYGISATQNDTDTEFNYDREDYAVYGAGTVGQSEQPPPLREPEQIWQEEVAKWKALYEQKCAELELIRKERDDAKKKVAEQEMEVMWFRNDPEMPASPDSNPASTQSSTEQGTTESTNTSSVPTCSSTAAQGPAEPTDTQPIPTSSAASVPAAAATASASLQRAREPKRPGLKRPRAKISDASPSDIKQAEPAAGGESPQLSASTAGQKRERDNEQDAREPAPKRSHTSDFGPSAFFERASTAGQKRGREDAREQDASEPVPKRPAHRKNFVSSTYDPADDSNVFTMSGGREQKRAGEDAKSSPTKRSAYAVPNSSSRIPQGSAPATSHDVPPVRSNLNESQAQPKNIRLHGPTESAFRTQAQKWLENIRGGKKQKTLIQNFPPAPGHLCIGPRCPGDQDKMPEARRRIHEIEEVYETLVPAGKHEEKLRWLRTQQNGWHWNKVAHYNGTADGKQELRERFDELYEATGNMIERVENKTQHKR